MRYTVNFSKIDVYEVIKNNMNNEYIQILLNSLPTEEKEVIELRIEKKTRKYIAELKNTTYDRVRGMEERALKHLKHPARLQLLNKVLDPDFTISENAKNYLSR